MVNGFHYNIKDRMDSFALVYLYVGLTYSLLCII